jgi:hypothetical protein
MLKSKGVICEENVWFDASFVCFWIKTLNLEYQLSNFHCVLEFPWVAWQRKWFFNLVESGLIPFSSGST